MYTLGEAVTVSSMTGEQYANHVISELWLFNLLDTRLPSIIESIRTEREAIRATPDRPVWGLLTAASLAKSTASYITNTIGADWRTIASKRDVAQLIVRLNRLSPEQLQKWHKTMSTVLDYIRVEVRKDVDRTYTPLTADSGVDWDSVLAWSKKIALLPVTASVALLKGATNYVLGAASTGLQTVTSAAGSLVGSAATGLTSGLTTSLMPVILLVVVLGGGYLLLRRRK